MHKTGARWPGKEILTPDRETLLSAPINVGGTNPFKLLRMPGVGLPVNRPARGIKGAVNQEQNGASGLFLDAGNSGIVILSE